jgi:hypothetical protein
MAYLYVLPWILLFSKLTVSFETVLIYRPDASVYNERMLWSRALALFGN